LSGSLNKSILKSKYELIAIIWCDCILVGEDWLKNMINKYIANEKIASVRSNLILPNEVWQKYNFWNKVNTLEEYIRNIKCIKFGRPTLFSKKLIKKFGLYDNKTFRIAGEDTDLCLKLIKKGYKLPLANTDIIHMHGFYKLSLKNQLFKKALPLSEASGVIFRKHLFLSNKYRNALTYSIIYLFASIPSLIQPLFLIFLGLIILIYTSRILIYIKDIRVLFIPIFKIIKDLISLFGFWKGFITGKQRF
jgi:GT2 family glycosyltransferase